MADETPVDELADEPSRHDTDLGRLLSVLPPGQREALTLRFVDSSTLSEIAIALGIPEGTVKSRLHSAIARLRSSPGLKDFSTD